MAERHVGSLGVAALAAVLLAGAVELQAVRERIYPPPSGAEEALYLTSGAAVRRLSGAYAALAADLYWIRAIQHFGATKRRLADQALALTCCRTRRLVGHRLVLPDQEPHDESREERRADRPHRIFTHVRLSIFLPRARTATRLFIIMASLLAKLPRLRAGSVPEFPGLRFGGVLQLARLRLSGRAEILRRMLGLLLETLDVVRPDVRSFRILFVADKLWC